MRILIASTGTTPLRHLSRALEAAGYEVREAETGREALELVREIDPSLAILDLVLPDIGGRDLARILRGGHGTGSTDVLVLAGPEITDDSTLALGGGGDEPVVRWSHTDEIVAIVDSTLHRASSRDQVPFKEPLFFEHVSIDPRARSVRIDGKSVELTQKEFELLLVLAANDDRPCTREELRKNVWGDDAEIIGRTIDVLVSRLRSKLTDATGRDFVSTVRGVGYRFSGGSH